MQIKNELRLRLKQKRANILNKSEKDRLICANFLNSSIYASADEILCYCSYGSEVDTSAVICQAIHDGKKLYLPKCLDKNGKMTFYLVKDATALKKGAFGIMEPDISVCKPFKNSKNAVCVVPGLSFDPKGYRLGYGKGYYDRFLEKFTITSVGLCYNELISESLPAESHDLPVDYIITEEKMISV